MNERDTVAALNYNVRSKLQGSMEREACDVKSMWANFREKNSTAAADVVTSKGAL